jgi:hypothetical protein
LICSSFGTNHTAGNLDFVEIRPIKVNNSNKVDVEIVLISIFLSDHFVEYATSNAAGNADLFKRGQIKVNNSNKVEVEIVLMMQISGEKFKKLGKCHRHSTRRRETPPSRTFIICTHANQTFPSNKRGISAYCCMLVISKFKLEISNFANFWIDKYCGRVRKF